MYLVLVPETRPSTRDPLNVRSQDMLDDQIYKVMATTSIETVAGTIRKYEGCKIFKLDSLTEVTGIDVTFEEVTKETESE